MKWPIWISFDLGVRGDYQGMYEFLDAHNAKECGDSMAFLLLENQSGLVAKLKKMLGEYVDFDARSRVYVVFPDSSGKYKGRFIKGSRKQAPWTGYATLESDEEDSGE
jgi:hypothetical protein